MRLSRIVGAGLIVLSVAAYLAVLSLPLVPGEAAVKVALGAGLVVAGEIAFWAGAVLVGREIVVHYRRRLDPRRLLARIWTAARSTRQGHAAKRMNGQEARE